MGLKIKYGKHTHSQVLIKAEEIIRSAKKLQDHLRTCYKAEICPECGESLLLNEYNRHFIFGSAKIIKVYCPNGHKLPSPDNDDFEVSNLSSDVWKYSIGLINRKYKDIFEAYYLD